MNWRPIIVCCALSLPLFGTAYALDNSGATVDQTADRLESRQVTDTLPPPPQPNPRQLVNAIHYSFYEPQPALEAYRITAAAIGWPQSKIQAWEPFARDVMLKESGFCWNRLRGDVMRGIGHGCEQIRQGTHEDAGIAQLTSSLWGRDAILCQGGWYCSKWAIIAEPWTSFHSFLLVLDIQGSRPWCYSGSARNYHRCGLAPDR